MPDFIEFCQGGKVGVCFFQKIGILLLLYFLNPHCVKKLRKKEKTVDNLVIYQQFKLFDFVLSSISAT
jgi:hypothetical protein